MSDVRTEAELTRLAATLAVGIDEVRLFAPAGPDAVRRVTEQLSDALTAEGAKAFESVARLAERLPGGLATTLAQRVLGPVLTARAAAALAPETAAQLAQRLPPSFLAGVAASIDPRHVAELLARIEPETAVAVALELERTDDVLTMGLLMAQISPRALEAAAGQLGDATILRAGLFVEDPARIDEVVAGLDDARLRRLAETADERGLQAELDDLATRLTGRQAERVAALR